MALTTSKIFDNKKDYEAIKLSVEMDMRNILQRIGTNSPYYTFFVNRDDAKGDNLAKIDWDAKDLPLSFELIWSYFMELAGLVQTMNVICLRFQNIYHPSVTPISRFDLSPLRPLSHVLWAYLQDEQFRLSIRRRILEYDHEYGLQLPIPGMTNNAFKGIDTRSQFLESFHNLLTSVSQYYNEKSDLTRQPNAFPLSNNLRELHLILSEGNSNAYSDLTWVARKEMMIQEKLLDTTEMKEYLGGRPMVRYPGGNQWMANVDTMRQIQGWGNTSITYFFELAQQGELILLSVRYGDWSTWGEAEAKLWADNFKDAIQKYIYAYRTVTGVDLSYEALNSTPKELRTTQPYVLIQQKVAAEKARRKPA